jgi:hypothetical protein
MARPNWFALLLLVLPLSIARAQSVFAGTPDAEPGFGLYAAEAGGALLTGALLTAGTLLVVDPGVFGPTGDHPNGNMDGGIIGFFLGMAGTVVAYPLGCAAGTSIVGGIKQQYGNFGYSYLGALLGLPVGYGIAVGGLAMAGRSPVLRGVSVVAGCLAPPVGATVGYNLSRRSDAGYGRLEQRLVPPSIGVRSWSDLEGQTVVATDVRLLTVRF